MRLSFLLILSLLTLQYGFCQWEDDFSGPELKNWRGDTASFTINGAHKLQLAAEPVSSSKAIFRESSIINNATWEIDLELLFNPSSSNYVDLYLVADSLSQSNVSGYFVRIGNTQDEASLYKSTNGSIEKIIDGADDRVDLSSVEMTMKVTRSDAGLWELFSDIGKTGTFVKEGEVVDNDFVTSDFFIIRCKYTSTRAEKFLFDNIQVTGESNTDLIVPKVLGFEVADERTLAINFSERVNYSLSNFLENCNYQIPANAENVNDSSISITFENKFPENRECHLMLSGVKDAAQNSLDTTLSFTYYPPPQPQLNELIFTEIMADPSPTLELPDAEYLELLNPTSDTFELTDLKLVVRNDSLEIPPFSISPGEFVILTSNSKKESLADFGRVVGISNWKALLNGGDTVHLVNKYHDLVFELIYSENWYDDPEKGEGGYSLEMIDPSNSCGGKENWNASNDIQGGTPGKPNSVASTNPDITNPIIVSAFPTDQYSVELKMSERIVSKSIDAAKLSLDPYLQIASLHFQNHLAKSVVVELSDSLNPNSKYLLKYSGLKDCAGNVSGKHEKSFVLPQAADSLDIVFNEIMYDPVPGGVEYIEIFNRSEKHIDLFDWQLVRVENDEDETSALISDEHVLIPPKGIFVITENKNVLIGQFPGSEEDRILETNLFPLPNDGGEIRLKNNLGQTIDWTVYQDQLHHPFIKESSGISLERIEYSFGSSSHDSWQSASSVTNGGTPTLGNSHSIHAKSFDQMLIEPKVFVPDNDGYRDFTTIRYQMDRPGALASIYVFDLSGRLVKTLMNQQNIPDEGFVIWEGDNENGVKTSFGNYIVFMELTFPDGVQKIFKETVAIASKF